ncbi:MAG: acetyl/propionyl/methylcrotonyl-CoA carboxylase subunit alpha [Gammaproteobacteria bacterium]|nr:acetyl/propionyl/methylcrotonyl-CoA carboxylase subunit alpha [Gammaproteobacteria bacterium]
MFDKLLIANRGEIACRVIRTARRLGIGTVGIYSDADRHARHVALSDEAYYLGPPPAQYSYLNIEAIVDAARRSGATAIHPGYGFLAENPEFASACARAGICFVGPSAEALRTMGSKSIAKDIMRGVGVPLITGYHGEDQRLETLQREANTIGYPVLIKASAGGGGKGMRIVKHEKDFAESLAAAKREAVAAFGDDKVLLERFVERPRHIEVQVFGDTHGNMVHLFDRDCSVQRRHQKIIEEAPAPRLSAERHEAMAAAAITAANAIEYLGAGTVEFIVDDDGTFYFMEMNTRLQVEHPVTEMITGQDLVEWQLRVAAGEPLPRRQHELDIRGHAVEARIYAEDPQRGFLPATGRLTHLRFPQESSYVRVESGVQRGDMVSVHYDPMIAKLVVWDRDRSTALVRLSSALAQTQIVGVTHNTEFLSSVVGHTTFCSARFDTGLLDRDATEFLAVRHELPQTVLALACVGVLLNRAERQARRANHSNDCFSPWHLCAGWRLNEDPTQTLRFLQDDLELQLRLTIDDNNNLKMELPSKITVTAADYEMHGDDLTVTLNGVTHHATIVFDEALTVFFRGSSYRVNLHDPSVATDHSISYPGTFTAPMPGRIIDVLVKPGTTVQRDAPLIVLEAMKMEHTIKAHTRGKVTEVHVRPDDLVDEGTQLLKFEENTEGRIEVNELPADDDVEIAKA